jgi:hypothetical protein
MNMYHSTASIVGSTSLIYPFLSPYFIAGDNRCEDYERADSTATASISFMDEPEKEINPYELMCSNGAFAFWDDPEEDIYSFDDGEAL